MQIHLCQNKQVSYSLRRKTNQPNQRKTEQQGSQAERLLRDWNIWRYQLVSQELPKVQWGGKGFQIFVPHISHWWVRNKVTLGDLSKYSKTGARAHVLYDVTFWRCAQEFQDASHRSEQNFQSSSRDFVILWLHFEAGSYLTGTVLACHANTDSTDAVLQGYLREVSAPRSHFNFVRFLVFNENKTVPTLPLCKNTACF